MKRDSDSLFEREMKLWQDKKDLGKEKKSFDAKMCKGREDMSREAEKIKEDKKHLVKERKSFEAKMSKGREAKKMKR